MSLAVADPVGVTPALGYRRGLDGIRGVSIVLVLAYHASVPTFEGGFLGVDVFFVLSGFLISTLLIEEYEKAGRIALARFYGRRALRLAPALVAMLAVFTVYEAIGLEIGWRAAFTRSVVPFFYLSNWTRALDMSALPLYEHTWSLGIEEQFYLVWAPAIFLLMRALGVRRLVSAIAALLVAVCLARGWAFAHGVHPRRLYNGFDARSDGLLMGCLAAALRSNGRTRWVEGRAALVAGLGLLAGSGWIYLTTSWTSPALYYGGFPLVTATAAFWILRSVQRPDSLLTRALELTPLVFLGRLSYSLYVWHYPFYRIIDWHVAEDRHAVRYALFFGVSLAAALVSYYGIERTFLKMKARLAPPAA